MDSGIGQKSENIKIRIFSRLSGTFIFFAMETGDRDTVYSNLSRDILNHELPSLSPVSMDKCSLWTVLHYLEFTLNVPPLHEQN